NLQALDRESAGEAVATRWDGGRNGGEARVAKGAVVVLVHLVADDVMHVGTDVDGVGARPVLGCEVGLPDGVAAGVGVHQGGTGQRDRIVARVEELDVAGGKARRIDRHVEGDGG